MAFPPRVFRHSIGLAASSISPHSRGIGRHSVGLEAFPSSSQSVGITVWFFLLAGTLSLAEVFAPWRPPSPDLLAATEVALPVLPPLAAVPPGLPYAPLSSVPSSVFVQGDRGDTIQDH